MKKILAVLVALALLFAASCAPAPTPTPPRPTTRPTTRQTTTAPPATWQTITAQQAYDIMAQTDGFFLLDVRTAAEFQEGFIEGAVLIPYGEIRARANELPNARTTVILIYCRTGRRSAIAAQTLASLRFTAVHDFGGIVDWPGEIVIGGN